jgi:hypothetical protein
MPKVIMALIKVMNCEFLKIVAPTSVSVLGVLCGCLKALDGTLQIIAERNRLLGYRGLNPKRRFTFEY